MRLKVRQSLKDKIFESYERNKTSTGEAVVSRISRDVFGGRSTSRESFVKNFLTSCGVACRTRNTYNLRYVEIARTEAAVPPADSVEIKSEPETEMQSDSDDLDVELYLAIKAKSGCKKAFRILKQLV